MLKFFQVFQFLFAILFCWCWPVMSYFQYIHNPHWLGIVFGSVTAILASIVTGWALAGIYHTLKMSTKEIEKMICSSDD
jgi:hypothetical protein